ncbi:MAG: bifunctional (p)ppGpp synthetase/guanosine-3',5'-bis(diphosphate) 3'-pyrophosphohydrolase [Bacilli bacterium]|nr:bifunctional (p)ppGpp synthetase/guanosine-3',5'-bis(diphosphate) 3'-pyrophosphohydrolase [Bacilli bacterium]
MKKEISTIEQLISSASYITDPDEINTIRKAYDYAKKIHKDSVRLSGEDYILHPLNVAYILTSLNADSDTLASALLHDTIHIGNADINDIKKEFSDEIVYLLEGITTINRLSLSAENENMINYYKKILVGLTEDVRIIIIKLAERCHNMRTLWAIPKEKQALKAKETLEILAPIAHRLGLSYIKAELEELSLKYYKPEAYNSIEEELNNTKEERDASVNEMKRRVSNILVENNIEFEIKGRAKSIYSIYNKLQKGKKLSDIYDIYALRVIVNTKAECYQVLGLIHAKYKPLPKRFKDYIANPKTNMYQSLHTTVFGFDGKPYEIQIRTFDMDKVAERGIASHWSYKEQGKKIQNSMEQKLQLFRNIMELNNDDVSDEEFVKSVQSDVLGENVYVYTPKGDVYELPVGATPIDFAYRVHTKIGETMVGAIVNDNIVPLNYELQTGDIVKINTNKASTPSKEWLNIVKSNQTKNKIRAFFSKVDKKQAIEKGRNLILKELRRKKITINDFNDSIPDLLKSLKLNDENELYLSIGTGKFSPNTIINSLLNDELDKEEYVLNKLTNKEIKKIDLKNDVLVNGIDQIKVTLANCCKPIKGDEIVGYISRGNGIIVHSKNCHNLKYMDERMIDVSWNEEISTKFQAKISVLCIKKDNLLLDIITKTSGSGINITKVDTKEYDDNIIYNIILQVENLEALNKYINSLGQLSSVINVERIYN